MIPAEIGQAFWQQFDSIDLGVLEPWRSYVALYALDNASDSKVEDMLSIAINTVICFRDEPEFALEMLSCRGLTRDVYANKSLSPKKEVLILRKSTRIRPQEMSEHIQQLVRDHKLDLHLKENTSARAWKKQRKIRIAPVKSAITYSLALHEIGHILGKQPKLRLDREVAAWEWAKENAMSWTDSMQKKAEKCLQSYLARSLRHRSMSIPEANHPVWQWISKTLIDSAI